MQQAYMMPMLTGPGKDVWSMEQVGWRVVGPSYPTLYDDLGWDLQLMDGTGQAEAPARPTVWHQPGRAQGKQHGVVHVL